MFPRVNCFNYKKLENGQQVQVKATVFKIEADTVNKLNVNRQKVRRFFTNIPLKLAL